jgi:hypothetical protein
MKREEQEQLAAEIGQRFPEVEGCTWEYMYPGFFAFHTGSFLVACTPDNTNEGEIDVQVTTNDGDFREDLSDVVPYTAPLTAEAFVELMRPYLVRARGRC